MVSSIVPAATANATAGRRVVDTLCRDRAHCQPSTYVSSIRRYLGKATLAEGSLATIMRQCWPFEIRVFLDLARTSPGCQLA